MNRENMFDRMCRIDACARSDVIIVHGSSAVNTGR